MLIKKSVAGRIELGKSSQTRFAFLALPLIDRLRCTRITDFTVLQSALLDWNWLELSCKLMKLLVFFEREALF